MNIKKVCDVIILNNFGFSMDLYIYVAYLLTGRLWFSDDSDEFFIIENRSSVLNDATLPVKCITLIQ